MSQTRNSSGRLRPGLAAGCLAALTVGLARAQDTPPLPSPSVPPAAAEVAGSTREAVLEDRIRQLESMVNRLSGQMEQMSTARPAQGAVGGTPAGGTGAGDGRPSSAASIPGNPGVAGGGNAPAETGGRTGTGAGGTGANTAGGAPGQSTPPVPAPSLKYNMPGVAQNAPARTRFGPGFEIRSEDDEYILQFHDLTQIEFRGYQQGGQTPVHDTFDIPRQWYMFSGRIGKPFEYYVSFQQSYDTILPLDIFSDINFDPRLEFRIGRFKTPFTYEFYNQPIQSLIQPERSLFFNNFALNRQVGAQVWGSLFTKRLDYAAGIFNTTQNGNLDSSDGKDFLAYLNYRPFLTVEDSPLQFLQFGGSVDLGNQFNTPVPQTLRTAIATTGNNILGVPFLAFNNNVRQAGYHTLWSPHVALYRNSLSVIAEYQGGYQDYALSTNLQQRTHLPIQSFYVQGGYFITGETVSGRNVPNPIRPFDLRKGKLGPGAWELTGRYNMLNVGNQVFTNGLSDPNVWTNNLYTTDLGFNWYLTRNTKVTFTWEHAVFGSPVEFAPGREQKTSDLFILRYQLYF